MAKFDLEKLHQLRNSVGKDVDILTDPTDTAFIKHAKRWTDIDRKVPAAIILPTSEEEIQKTVQWAVGASVPFVTKSGGHSEWSTIDDSGVIIDLSKFSEIEVDSETQTAILKGSILSKQVADALADVGLFTALGNGNPIGSIPYFLGGGASIVTATTGYGSDQIISARMIDAKGNIVEVTEEKEPDLLWALRGAGQFFGLVTELKIKAHPFAKLGNSQGHIWMGSFGFPLALADEVASVMQILMDDSSKATAGLLMVMAPPPNRDPILLVAARYTGDPDDAKAAYKPLYGLQPIFANGEARPIQNVSNGHEVYNAHGTFKRFGVVGLRRFDKEGFLKTIDVWKQMIQECPDAADTSFNFQWDSQFSPTPPFDSAMSLHDIRFWQNNFIWHTDPASRAKVDRFNDEAIDIMRGPDASEYADFQNGTRTGPIELRFRGEGKLGKLRLLKEQWDPTGVFTTQLLN